MSYLPLRFEPSEIFAQKIVMLRPEVHLMYSSGTLSKKIRRKTGTNSPIFELSYSQKNTLHGEVDSLPVDLQPGHTSLGFLGDSQGYSEYNNGDEVQLYSLWISPRAFNNFGEAISGKSSINFSSFQQMSYYHCNYRNDVREEIIKKKLEDCFSTKTDNFNKLIIESYILELLSINLEKLFNLNNSSCHLSKTDIEQLTYARDILLMRLDSPPSILELSHMIHMNDFKLKKFFKEYFGTTVYGFIREQRLEKAFSLLEQKNCNVSQAAFSVGYTNVSHFSEQFQKKFGFTPRSLCK